MSTNIKDTELGEGLVAYGDAFFRGEDISSAGTVTSDAFRLGNTDAGVEVKVKAASDFTLADTKSLSVKILNADIDGVTYSSLATMGTITASGDLSVSTGDILASYILPVENVGKPWAKVQVITDSASSGATVDGNIEQI